MKQFSQTVRRHIDIYWAKYWSIPDSAKPFVFNLLVAWSMLGFLLLWLVLSPFQADEKLLELLRPFLPGWFPIANLFFAPILAALVGGPLRIRPTWRLLFTVLMLCSLSALYLSFRGHQLTTLVVTGLLYVEAFLVIPRWNKSMATGRGSAEPHRSVVPFSAELSFEDSRTTVPRTANSKIVDFAIYIGIAILIAFVLVLYVLKHP